ncbi:MAG: bifunctional phosphopantothenoylcysteine decarboxylase/phosphopantothenate--cysteine ligase CoaBC [Rhodospirillales bacterium]|nr:bifunctional phosphopantothenoylcysteine decarboxylase/phosphopantothenate--cysteine ligase CoaBC [Rhodospirillales bacterium]MCB9995417.1 bifunctional phosphopantothenoylcysteine decarboxylase/phosphopantothenate--cysteine ligase CoaBC [Rhodospirillales bacterium]
MQDLTGKTILLVISGGIAAYKSLELIRLIRKAGGRVRCILTKGGAQFITPLSVAALSEEPVYEDLFSLKDETEMGHIRLSREADLILVAPASANMIAKMAHGMADSLAAATLLATNKPVMIAPAMNQMMWANPATQANIETLATRGITLIGPTSGDMACGETGLGRMAEPEEILGAVMGFFYQSKPLSGLSALVTSGPTYEPLDPVRFIGNRSSGKQGHAIAASLAAQGADVTLVTGPVSLPDPQGVKTVHVETAVEMLDACRQALPADIAICAAAVSDWSAAAVLSQKIKKRGDRQPPDIKLKENPDILAALAGLATPKRPKLVIGFAAETENLIEAAAEKRRNKGCDWIIANQVGPADDGMEKVFGRDENHVYLITDQTTEEWQKTSKQAIADKLADYIARWFTETRQTQPAPMAAE